ncbi:MAG TPA: hypothetical protein VMT47_13200 [Polyangia bacterium]|nr:hypothetical protein [Polyangia bacterium]
MSSGTRHGTGQRSQPSDEEFERALIDSARADELPEARANEAWSAFAGRLAGVAGGLPGIDGSAAPRGATGPEVTAVVRSGYGAATRWLLLGAVGGGVVATGFMWRYRSERAWRPASEAIVSVGASGERLEEGPNRARVALAEPDDGPTRAPLDERRRTVRPPRPREASGASEPSSLAAEVAMLDAARKAAAAGDPDTALRLIDRYRYDFPEGELAADTEVVAIEALAAKGKRDEVARRVAGFLALRPNDPHAAEVKRLGRVSVP